jgi:nuclear protein localization family protein 4
VIDEYRNEVTQLARPLPVEYLLLDLPAAFPVEPVYTFYASSDIKPFAIAHRETMGETQVIPLDLDVYH